MTPYSPPFLSPSFSSTSLPPFLSRSFPLFLLFLLPLFLLLFSLPFSLTSFPVPSLSFSLFSFYFSPSLPISLPLQAMHAHAQFCWSGDNTVKATKQAMTTISQEPADEHYVIVLSDANFSRYYINPKEYGQLLISDSKVKTFAIFIGSLGDEATRYGRHM